MSPTLCSRVLVRCCARVFVIVCVCEVSARLIWKSSTHIHSHPLTSTHIHSHPLLWLVVEQALLGREKDFPANKVMGIAQACRCLKTGAYAGNVSLQPHVLYTFRFATQSRITLWLFLSHKARTLTLLLLPILATFGHCHTNCAVRCSSGFWPMARL